MEYIRKYARKYTRELTEPYRNIKSKNSNITLYTTYRDFPRNTKLPPLYLAEHQMEDFIKKLSVTYTCRGLGFDEIESNALKNRSNPSIIKILIDWDIKRIIGYTIAHLKGKDLYVDLLCARKRDKSGSPKKLGFGTKLIEELKKEALRFNAKYLTLRSARSAYHFYTREEMGFTYRPRDGVLQLKVPPLNSNEGKKLLPEGRPNGMRPAGQAHTSLTTAQMQRALSYVGNKRTAPVASKKNPVSTSQMIRNALENIKKTSYLPSTNTKTTASTAIMQKALAAAKKSPSPRKLSPLPSVRKTRSPRRLSPLPSNKKSPSPRKLSPLPSVRKTRSPRRLSPLPSVRKSPSPRRLSPLPSVRKTRSPKSKQGNSGVNRLRKSQ